LGFTHAAVGAMVRSSYHADQQAERANMQKVLSSSNRSAG
jgi:lipoic acid synthetase